MTPHCITYVDANGRLGLLNDQKLQPIYQEIYTTLPVGHADISFILAGFVPLPLLVAVQVRRMFREDEAHAQARR